MKKILVTGSAGFIGYHLVKRLLKERFTIVGIDNINDYYDVNLKYGRLAECGIYSKYESDRNGGENRSYKEITYGEAVQSVTEYNYKFYRYNIEDKSNLLQLFEIEKFDYVVNLAAQAGVRFSIENPDLYIQSNIVGFFNILECCRYFPVKQLVYASSSSVYGANSKIPFSIEDKVDNPVSLYAATKKSNELMAHAYSHLFKIPTIGLRFFTVYGPWGRPDMAPMLFANAISKGQPINVFNNGEMERDFTYIDDVIEGIFRVLLTTQNKGSQKPYVVHNIGHGYPIKLNVFIECIEKYLGKKAQIKLMQMQPGDVKKTWANNKSLIEVIGRFKLTTLEEGIEHFIKWYEKYSL